MRKIINAIKEGLEHVLFPNVCLCCGREALEKKRHLCDFCLHKRFEDANPENALSSSDVILPQNVLVQHALWQFDKGGALQNLMHHLKYERLTAVGLQFGKVLGRRMKNHPKVSEYLKNDSALLLPVPLHYLKFRKRGFNQAFFIAAGTELVWEIPICPIEAVVRRKFTLTQTGFTLEKRIKNMNGAFRVRKPEAISDKVIIIIDDVFTTGATTFELAKTVLQAGAKSAMIWTIAQA